MKYGLTLVLFLLINLPQTKACCCTGYTGLSIAEKVNKTDVIVVGKIVLVTSIPYPIEVNSTTKLYSVNKYSIVASTIYKGDTSSRIVQIYTAPNSCASIFEVGKEYIIYADYRHNEEQAEQYNVPETYMYTWLCKGNMLKNNTNLSKLNMVSTPIKTY